MQCAFYLLPEDFVISFALSRNALLTSSEFCSSLISCSRFSFALIHNACFGFLATFRSDSLILALFAMQFTSHDTVFIFGWCFRFCLLLSCFRMTRQNPFCFLLCQSVQQFLAFLVCVCYLLQ